MLDAVMVIITPPRVKVLVRNQDILICCKHRETYCKNFWVIVYTVSLKGNSTFKT